MLVMGLLVHGSVVPSRRCQHALSPKNVNLLCCVGSQMHVQLLQHWAINHLSKGLLGDCRGFVGRFFQCSDCAQHFMEMASEPAAAHVKSRKQAILWMWSAHNRVCRISLPLFLLSVKFCSCWTWFAQARVICPLTICQTSLSMQMRRTSRVTFALMIEIVKYNLQHMACP